MSYEYEVVFITTKKPGVNNPEAETTQSALEHLDYRGVSVRMGMQFVMDLSAANMQVARETVLAITKENTKLWNPVLENITAELRQMPDGSFSKII